MKHSIIFLWYLFPILGFTAENMFIHGALVAPPCTISDGKTIEVPFGNNIGVNKIDGNSYKQSVDYSLSCDTGFIPSGLAIVVDTSSPALFDNSAVNTDKAGLGIRVLVDGLPATFSQVVVVNDLARPPQIEAVPVKDPGVTLTEGAFEATMTLRADYI